MGRRRRISAPDGDVSNQATATGAPAASNEAKMAVGRSNRVELSDEDLNLAALKHDVSETDDKVKRKGKKRKKGSVKKGTIDIDESVVTDSVDEELLETEQAKEVQIPQEPLAGADQLDNLVLRKLLVKLGHRLME